MTDMVIGGLAGYALGIVAWAAITEIAARRFRPGPPCLRDDCDTWRRLQDKMRRP